MKISLSLTEQERKELQNLFRAGGVRLRKGEVDMVVNPEDCLPERVEVEEDAIFPEGINLCLELLEEEE